jgi:hypothetical protein
MLAAFFLGCIATEIRWIAKMRRLRTEVETERVQAETAVSANATDKRVLGFRPEEGTEQGLIGLQQHLIQKTEASPVPQGDPEA